MEPRAERYDRRRPRRLAARALPLCALLCLACAQAAPPLHARGASARASGLDVDDPFRALEADTEATRAWMDAQTERTERALARGRDAAAEARLRELLSIGALGTATLTRTRAYFTLREGERERQALFAVAADARAALDPTPIVDPASYGPRAALDYVFPSPSGRYLAFGVSDSGDERATLRVYDTLRSALLPDTIAHAKWCALDWLHDDSGFYYTRYPRPGEPGFDGARPDAYFTRVFFHRVGDDPAADRLVFGGSAPTDFPAATVDDTGRWVAIANFRSFTASDVWLWDRGADPTARPLAPERSRLTAVVVGEDKLTSGRVQGDFLYLLTNLDAPKKRLLRVPLSLAAQRGAFQTVVPESSASLQDFVLTRDHVAVNAIDDLRSRVLLFTLAGQPAGEVPLPARGSVDELSASPDRDALVFIFSSYFHPPTLYHYDVATRELRALYQVRTDLDVSRFVLEQATVTSADGTAINVYYARDRRVRRDGNAPVLLRGYGGFDVSLLPVFTRTALYLLERGAIYAEANLRGGGEHGESWHRAGMLEHKHHVFEDFEAAIRWFSDSGWSRPGRIAITGGSNGGLLVGALLTRAPQTFGAAAAYVGLYDMLRYPLFPPAELWVSEYGDPKDPRAARYLAAYSPYHNVREGVAYPATLIETADHDTRVHPSHSAKFAARLQQASAGPAPIYFYRERDTGHGRGTGLTDLVRREARKLAFLRAALGL